MIWSLAQLGHGSGSDEIVAQPTKLSKQKELCKLRKTVINLTSHKSSNRSLHYIISLSIFVKNTSRFGGCFLQVLAFCYASNPISPPTFQNDRTDLIREL